jgi:hypothetical protein
MCPLTPHPLTAWPAFAAAVEARLQQGTTTYGNASFTRNPADLASEIEQELLDVCAWSFILWCRVRALRDRLPAGGAA